MKKTAIKVLKYILPNVISRPIKRRVEKNWNDKFMKNLRDNILSYYSNEINLDDEKKVIVDYLKENPVSVFPYDFAKKYSRNDVKVLTDEIRNLKYVIHEGKKLYFKRSMTEAGIKSLYVGLQLDQDPESPHLYLTEDFELQPNDVIADIGAAEGNFSLSNIDRVKKVYLFECDEDWIEALEATFEPWKHKVEIINKYVTNTDSESTISMNTFYKSHPEITFFKVDIEGEEQNFLDACEPVFSKEVKMKMVICTYHKHNDEVDFTKQLSNWGFKVTPSKGFMIFVHDRTIKTPFLRRGLLRVQK